MSPWPLIWLCSTAALAWQAGRWSLGLARLRRQDGHAKGRAQADFTRPQPVEQNLWLLIAARDEVTKLPALAKALAEQGTGAGLRIVLVDDGSRDGSAALARREFARWPGAQVLERPARGKLAALAEGLALILAQAAEDDIVLFTDADCRPRSSWLDAHRAAHADGARLVCGHKVLMLAEPDSRRTRFRRFENALSSLQCALGCELGRPAFARGGNWSARAGDLRRCGGLAGLEGMKSGDDVHLVRRLVAVGAGRSARFLLSSASQVETDESGRPRALSRQARRRYGKLADLPLRERLRQIGLFAALALQPGLLLVWLTQGRREALGPALFLISLALVARSLMRTGLALLGESELARAPLSAATRLALHAAWHSLAGSWGGYQWKESPPAATGGQEGSP